MSVVELIRRRDHRVRLVWEQRCDCAPHDRPLVAAVYLHEGIRYLYVPAVKGPHVRTGARVKQRGRAAAGRDSRGGLPVQPMPQLLRALVVARPHWVPRHRVRHWRGT